MGVAHRVEAEHAGLAVGVDEPAPTVQQAGHHVHVGDRRRPVRLDVRCGGGDGAGDREERRGVLQRPSQRLVVAAHGQGHRERAVVAAEHAELQEVEVATDRAELVGVLGAVEQREEPGVVDDPGVLDLLGDLDTEGTRQTGQGRAPSARVDDEVGVEHGAVGELHPRDRRRTDGPRSGSEPDDPLAVQQRRERRIAVGHHAPQHPLVGRATTGEGDEVLVARHGAAVHALGEHGDEVEWGRPGVEQRVEHVGVAVAQQVAQPGQECMGVAHLRRAPAVPVERAVRVGGEGRVVALDQHDLVSCPAGAQRDTQPGDARPDHHQPCHCHDRSPAVAPPASGPLALHLVECQSFWQSAAPSASTHVPRSIQRRTPWPRRSRSTTTPAASSSRA